MLVMHSTYDSLRELHLLVIARYAKLIEEHNKLIDRVNKNGGNSFLDGGILLTKDQLRDLIWLSHPDKHTGSDKAVRSTQLLLNLKRRLK